MNQPIVTGSAVAIATPFTSDTVDYPALKRLLDFQLDNGTDAVVVCGTTGEAATMSYVERMRTIESVVRHVDGRVPVIAGTGSNNTENAIALSRDALPSYRITSAPSLSKSCPAATPLIPEPNTSTFFPLISMLISSYPHQCDQAQDRGRNGKYGDHPCL